jgi:hypothetical protein
MQTGKLQVVGWCTALSETVAAEAIAGQLLSWAFLIWWGNNGF